MKAKAISLWQPWASLIASGAKVHETRSWKTFYQGPLLICAAQRRPAGDLLPLIEKWKEYLPEGNLPLGEAVALVDLEGCYMTSGISHIHTPTDEEMGDWSPGRYAWRLENVRLPIRPIPIKGHQGLWDVEINPEDFRNP